MKPHVMGAIVGPDAVRAGLQPVAPVPGTARAATPGAERAGGKRLRVNCGRFPDPICSRHTVGVDKSCDDATPARESLMHRAGHLTEGANEWVPAWLRPGNPESRWPVLLALIAAMALQYGIPHQYTVVPRWPLIALEVVLLIVLTLINPVRLTRSTRVGKAATFVLLAAITLDNTASAVILDYRIITGQVSNNAAVLLGSGAALFFTNVIVFGIWYWELDLGGPFARAGVDERHPRRIYPDFLFPQTDRPALAPEDWEPRFLDYLYVSLTNVIAFSPTDTMPLTRRAKAMMAVQSLVAVSTLALVIARAINVLK